MQNSPVQFQLADEGAAVVVPRMVRMYSLPMRVRMARSLAHVDVEGPTISRLVHAAVRAAFWVPINLCGQDTAPLREAPAVALVEDRFQELREIAEEEGTLYSFAAENDLRQFLNDADASARPAVFLRDDGSLRAKWRNLQGEQIGLHFIGGGRVQMVFFVHRRNGEMARLAGQDTLEGALCQVRSLRLQSLLKA